MRVSDHYQQEIQRRGYKPLPAHLSALAELDRCNDEWRHYKQRRGGPLSKMLIHPPLPRGVYMWGGVGVGKSFLMDCFFAVVPLERKLRIHFHEFMRATHREMNELKAVENPLHEVALRVARRYRLICFDEFHVSDIADAMILERLLAALVEARVGFVMTSNYPPNGLYPDGLHRDRLLPAIELIEDRLAQVELGGDDLRRLQEASIETGDLNEHLELYSSPLGRSAERQLARAFKEWAEGDSVERPLLEIQGRSIPAVRTAGPVAWFTFESLCCGPRAQTDYLELASQFTSFIVSDIPIMPSSMASEARRFTWLIDILYDHGCRLAVSAAAEPDRLYTAGQFAQEFSRTASRLVDMRSTNYLQSQRRETIERIA
ncbi:MAG: AFG1 family ATPase [Betaproteobacteria bacterium]|nr:AFG1 family ATPase [Betaproteobacteria bacterium]